METTIPVVPLTYRAEDVDGFEVFELNTRSYNWSIPGPTLFVKPGDLLKLTIANELEVRVCES